jgi:hypothetical protein
VFLTSGSIVRTSASVIPVTSSSCFGFRFAAATAALLVVTIAEMTAVDMNDVTGTNDAVTGMSRTDATTAVNAEDLVVTHRDVNKLSSTWNLYKKINIFDKNIFSSCCREFKSYNFRVSIFFSLKQKYNSQT